MRVNAPGATVVTEGVVAAGPIEFAVGVFVNSGQLRADGGRVLVHAGKVLNAGGLRADGGGSVRVEFTDSYIDTGAAVTSASGGSIAIDGGRTGRLFGSGSFRAAGAVGGSVDLFGREIVLAGSAVDASGEAGGAVNGKEGRLLLDPKNLVISAAPAGVLPQFDLIDPHPTTGGGFGRSITALGNGNVVVTNPNDDFGGPNAGAVYLFNGLTGALIRSLVGSSANDQLGNGGISVLGSGNYVIYSWHWNGNRGALTWGDGTRLDTGTGALTVWLYVVADNGVVTCLEAGTGKQVWQGRLEGGFSASPILVGDLLYVSSEAGKTFVLKTGPKFEVVATNDLGDGCFTTPAVCGGQIFLRTRHSLYCLRSRAADR